MNHSFEGSLKVYLYKNITVKGMWKMEGFSEYIG